jgi:hypothetical protein
MSSNAYPASFFCYLIVSAGGWESAQSAIYLSRWKSARLSAGRITAS